MPIELCENECTKMLVPNVIDWHLKTDWNNKHQKVRPLYQGRMQKIGKAKMNFSGVNGFVCRWNSSFNCYHGSFNAITDNNNLSHELLKSKTVTIIKRY